MNTKQIQITFVILLLSLFLVPMIFLQHWWGTQVGWPFGYLEIPNLSYGSTNFQWIWDIFLAYPTGFQDLDYMVYLALAATIGLGVDAALVIVSLKATAHRWFLALTSILNIGFGVAVISVTSWYTTVSDSFVFTPLGILLVALGGILIYQITRS